MIFYLPSFVDVTQLSDTIGQLFFRGSELGEEISDFSYAPPELCSSISDVLQRDVSLDGACFRKPYTFIHYESYTINTVFTAAVVLEPSKFALWRHKETGKTNIFNIEDLQAFIDTECDNLTKWDMTNGLLLRPGDLLMFKPWDWHCFNGGLLNVFKVEQNGV